MRRCTLRGNKNILKRQLIHVGAFNLSLILRKTLGAGTPRELKTGPQRGLYSFSAAQILVSIQSSGKTPICPRDSDSRQYPLQKTPLSNRLESAHLHHGLIGMDIQAQKSYLFLHDRFLPAWGSEQCSSSAHRLTHGQRSGPVIPS
jgi:hypothetical protein